MGCPIEGRALTRPQDRLRHGPEGAQVVLPILLSVKYPYGYLIGKFIMMSVFDLIHVLTYGR